MNNYNACERSGWRALPQELVRDEYTGRLVLPQFKDPDIRTRKYISKQIARGPLNRDDTDTENFIQTDVDPDDL